MAYQNGSTCMAFRCGHADEYGNANEGHFHILLPLGDSRTFLSFRRMDAFADAQRLYVFEGFRTDPPCGFAVPIRPEAQDAVLHYFNECGFNDVGKNGKSIAIAGLMAPDAEEQLEKLEEMVYRRMSHGNQN